MEIEGDFDLKRIANKVYAALVDKPESRDDDRLLMYMIWNKECQSLPLGTKFLDAFLDGKVSNPESIRRTRQKIQEKHCMLRGDKWDARHKSEVSICEQLRFFDHWSF